MYLYRIQKRRNLTNPFARERQVAEPIRFVFAVTKKKVRDKQWLLETLREKPQKAYLSENVLAVFVVSGVEEQGCLKALVWTDNAEAELLTDASVSHRHDLLYAPAILREIISSFNSPRKDIQILNDYVGLFYQPKNICYDYFSKKLNKKIVWLN